MRKWLSLLLAAMMVLGMLPAIATAEENPYAEHYKIVWTTYIAAPLNADATLLKMVEEKFNVDIDMLNYEDANFLEQLNLAIGSGDTPDVIRLKDPSQLVTYIDQGVIGEFDLELVREHLPFLTYWLDQLEDGAFWSMGAYEGAQYGIPGISNGNVFHLPSIYNKDWMEAVGVTETPKTLEELETLLYKFANEDPDGNGVKDTYGISSDGLRQLFGAYGVNPGAPDGRNDHSYFQLIDGKVTWAASSDYYREALKVAAKWYKDGVIDPEFITGENTGGYWAVSNSLIDGRIGMTVRGNYYHWVMPGMYKTIKDGEVADCEPGNVAKEWIAVHPEGQIAYGDPVEGPNGKGLKNWNMLAQFYVFNPETTADTGKFTRILDIMNYMQTRYWPEGNEEKQAYLEWAYGPEGENWYWTKKESGDYALRKEFLDLHPDVGPADDYGALTQWAPTVATNPTDDAALFAYSLGYDKGGISNLIQFSLPTMAEYQNNITMLKDNAMIDFIKGVRDVNDDAAWQKYIDEMNQAGLDKMVAEVTAWYEGNNK